MVRTIPATLVGLYMLVVLGIGFYFYNRRGADDYWIAGGKIPTYVNALALFAAFASGGSFLGAMGVAYSLGVPFIWSLCAGASLGVLIGSVLIGKPLRQIDAYTMTDIFDFIYDDWRINTVVPLVIIFGFTVYLIAQLKAAGTVASFVIEVGYPTAVIASGIVFLIYVAFGGMWAITITDFIQGLLMLLIAFVVSAVSLGYFGSPLAPLSQTPGIAAVGALPIISYVGFFIIWLAVSPVIPHLLMRVFSSESPESARRSLAWLAFMFAGFTTVTFYLVSAVAIDIAPELQNPDLALIIVMENILPTVITGVTAAAILAAVMSTTDALLLSISASVSNDLYGLVINPDASEEKIVPLGTAATVVVGSIAIFIAAFYPPALLIDLFSDALGLMSSALFFPMVLGIWWRRANAEGALTGILAGLVGYAGTYPYLPSFAPILVSLPASLVIMVTVTYLAEDPSESLLKHRSEGFEHSD